MKEYIPKTTGEYEDDYCRCAKRGWNMNLLDDVIGKLCRGEKLEGNGRICIYKDDGIHALMNILAVNRNVRNLK